MLSILWFMCPQLSWNVPSMPLVTPAKATMNKKGKAKPLAKAGAKRPTEQTTLTQMDLENTVDLHSIDKGEKQAIAAQSEDANSAGSSGRGAPGLKRKPKVPAGNIRSVAQLELEQASRKTRSSKQ